MRAVPGVALLVALACDRPACFVVRGGRYDAADLDTAAVVFFFFRVFFFCSFYFAFLRVGGNFSLPGRGGQSPLSERAYWKGIFW